MGWSFGPGGVTNYYRSINSDWGNNTVVDFGYSLTHWSRKFQLSNAILSWLPWRWVISVRSSLLVESIDPRYLSLSNLGRPLSPMVPLKLPLRKGITALSAKLLEIRETFGKPYLHKVVNFTLDVGYPRDSVQEKYKKKGEKTLFCWIPTEARSDFNILAPF